MAPQSSDRGAPGASLVVTRRLQQARASGQLLEVRRAQGGTLGGPLLSRWVELLAAASLLVLVGLDLAARSPLGVFVSAGESARFARARVLVPPALAAVVGLWLALTLRRWARERRDGGPAAHLRGALTGAGALLVLAGLVARRSEVEAAGVLAVAAGALLLLARAAVAASPVGALLSGPDRGRGLFLLMAGTLGALPALFDPAFERVRRHVELDSLLERLLSDLWPPVLAGVTTLWLALAPAGSLALARTFRAAWPSRPGPAWLGLLPFALAPAAAALALLGGLWSAVAWEARALDLAPLRGPVWLLLSAGLGGLALAASGRLLTTCPAAGRAAPSALLALSVWAGCLLPLTWALARAGGRAAWRWLLAALGASTVLVGWWVLRGGVFDPWFTATSYLKAALVKGAAVTLAAVATLWWQTRQEPGRVTATPAPPAPPTAGRELAGAAAGLAGLLLAGVVALFPFAALERRPEVKAAILDHHELAMVDAAYAGHLARLLGLDGWVRLGQAPPLQQDAPDPWPSPPLLTRVGPSRLPPGFNLLVVVVDALRGDAFQSAGYPRPLTPFLDRWAREEAVSFRRAYSQGGGTFAAFPFLVAGRSRFDLYGPQLARDNLFLALARAEGIRHWMVVRDFGPRAIFPSDAPVLELGPARPRPDGRSVPADEVFGWVRDAIDRLPPGDRFLAFVQLMDVHNDLWKKPGAPDFGDTPRDLYDHNVAYVDGAVARFVDWLRWRGLYRRTVLVLTSDHGEQFWEHGASLHGHTLFEEELRVPLILLLHTLRGRFEDVPVVTSDIGPTLVDLAGYTVEPAFDDPRMGVSLVPLLRDGVQAPYRCRDVVGRASFQRRYFLYRDWRWKLVYRADLDLLQLYDVARDPAERQNRLQEEPALAAELASELFAHLARVERRRYRPLLTAPPGPAPAGAGRRGCPR